MSEPQPYTSDWLSADELIAHRRRHRLPHVVILGAGASLAAFPDGDANGNRLPLMANVIHTLGLQGVLQEAGIDLPENFESLYSRLHLNDYGSPLLRRIEASVEEYFSQLSLPRHPTIYDFLLLSLRDKDAIFTFNWDPFLVDTYNRYVGKFPLPHIFHLHGNVRVSFCDNCRLSMRRSEHCPACETTLTPSRLLFPVEQKDYVSDPFTKSQWDAARKLIRNAFIITIFGYSAPNTDREAMSIFNDAWKNVGRDRLVERLEIIDTKPRNALAEQWAPFSFHQHYDTHSSIFDSLIARYPRRTCEAWYHIGVDGRGVDHVPWSRNLADLEPVITDLVAHE